MTPKHGVEDTANFKYNTQDNAGLCKITELRKNIIKSLLTFYNTYLHNKNKLKVKYKNKTELTMQHTSVQPFYWPRSQPAASPSETILRHSLLPSHTL